MPVALVACGPVALGSAQNDPSVDPLPSGLFTGPADDPRRYCVPTDALDEPVVGGEGLVYRALRTATGEVVALKVLTGTTIDDYPELSLRAHVMASIRHPNLMEHQEMFLGCSFGDGTAEDPAEFEILYSVEGWVDGEPLPAVAGNAEIAQKLAWVTEVAAALHCLHHHRNAEAPDGIVHRDVKPSNIRVRADGSAVLVDFGLARPVHPTDMTQGAGTYLWRAPEVLVPKTPIGRAADTWGLGATAHWLVVGQPPVLDGADAACERMATALHDAVYPSARTIARNLADLLHTNPRDRPDDLELWASRLDRRRRPRRMLPLVLAALLMVSLVTALVVYLPSDPPKDRERSTATSSGTSTTTSTPASADAISQTSVISETVTCNGVKDGDGTGHLRFDPPIDLSSSVATRQSIELTAPSSWVHCTSVRPAAVGDVSVVYPKVRFDDLSLEAPEMLSSALATGGGTLTGTATLGWQSGKKSVADVTVTVQDRLQGNMTLTITDGPLATYRGTASFAIDPLLNERPEGAAVDDAEVVLDALSVTGTATVESSGPAPPPTVSTDPPTAGALAAAAYQLLTVDHSFGPGSVPFTTFAIQGRTAPDASGAGPSRPFTEAERSAIEVRLSSLGEVVWIEDAGEYELDELTSGGQITAVVALSDPEIVGNTAHIVVSLSCGSLCGTSFTYALVSDDAGTWTVSGIEGPISVS